MRERVSQLRKLSPSLTDPAQAEFVRDTDIFKDQAPLYGQPRWDGKEVVQTRAGLEKLAQRLERLSCFPIDTETFGLGDEPINKRLSIIQIGIPNKPGDTSVQDKGETYLIDVLALEDECEQIAEELMMPPPNPLAPLKKVLEDSSIIKIAQNASFEKDQLDKYSINFQGIADTLTLARHIRPDMCGYALNALAVEFLGATLDKEQQKSAWGRRPLTARQELYAYLDPEVTYRVWCKQRDLQQASRVDRRLGPDRLMEDLVKETGDLQFLRRPIAHEYAVHDLKAVLLQEKLKEVLLEDLTERVGRLAQSIEAEIAPLLKSLPRGQRSKVKEALFTDFTIDLYDQKKAAEGKIQFIKGTPESRLLELLEERLKTAPLKVADTEQAVKVRITELSEEFKEQRRLSEEEKQKQSFSIPFSLPRYETEWGSAAVAQYADSEPDLEQLRKLLPDVAERIIFKKITKTDLDRALREAGMKKPDRDIIIEDVTVEGPLKEKFYLLPSFDSIYDPSNVKLPIHKPKARTFKVTRPKELESLATLLEKVERCTLRISADEQGLPSTVYIGIPAVVGKGLQTISQVAMIDIGKLTGQNNTTEAVAAALQPLKAVLESDKLEKIVVNLKNVSDSISAAGLSLSGTFNLQEALIAFRPDLPSTSPQACAVELFKYSIKENDAAAVHDVMMRSANEIKSLERTLKKEVLQVDDDSLPYEGRASILLKAILIEEGKKLQLVRQLGDDYTVSELKSRGIADRLEEQIRRKYETKKGEPYQHSCSFGQAGIQAEPTFSLDVEAVEERYPFVAGLRLEDKKTGEMVPVIKESFLWSDLDEELKSMAEGLLRPIMREQIREEVKELIGYQAPRFSVYPKYGNLY